MIADNQAVGGHGSVGDPGGEARGGGIANLFGASLAVSDSRLLRNQAFGGAGGDNGHGGSGLGGGIFNDGPSTLPSNPGAPTTLDISGCEIIRNEAIGGAGGVGGNGGQGLGGGLYNGASPVTIRRSVINANRAEGGAAGSGGVAGQGVGGGIYIASGGSVCVDALTAIFANEASTGDDDVFGTLCFI